MVSTWHRFAPNVTPGAQKIAAPLFISGVKLRHFWRGQLVEEENLLGKVDTAAVYTSIPLRLAIRMRLPNDGQAGDLKSFDKSIVLPTYPKYKVDLLVPKVGWKKISVIGCDRDDILLGLDVCRGMILLANWRRDPTNGCIHGFGLRTAQKLHRVLSVLFQQLKHVHQDNRIDEH